MTEQLPIRVFSLSLDAIGHQLICPINKKEDKMNRSNYKGITSFIAPDLVAVYRDNLAHKK